MRHKAWSFLFLLIFCAACSQNEATWHRIEQNGVLRVGLDPTYPPFEIDEGDGLRGIDVDLARALTADLGLVAEFHYFGYDGLYDALRTEKVDVLISALVIVPGQTKDFAYSDSYYNAGEILVVRQNDNEITQMADMNGRFLAVELGAQGHVEATIWARQIPDLTIQPYDTPDAALTAVLDGSAHAALVDSISGRLFLRQHPSLKRLSEPVTVEPYALVVRRQDERLLEKLNASLGNLEETGQLNQIIITWLSP